MFIKGFCCKKFHYNLYADKIDTKTLQGLHHINNKPNLDKKIVGELSNTLLVFMAAELINLISPNCTLSLVICICW